MRWIDYNRFETLLPMVVLDPSGEVERFTLSEGSSVRHLGNCP